MFHLPDEETEAGAGQAARRVRLYLTAELRVRRVTASWRKMELAGILTGTGQLFADGRCNPKSRPPSPWPVAEPGAQRGLAMASGGLSGRPPPWLGKTISRLKPF